MFEKKINTPILKNNSDIIQEIIKSHKIFFEFKNFGYTQEKTLHKLFNYENYFMIHEITQNSKRVLRSNFKVEIQNNWSQFSSFWF
jgi:hypothetical protein